MLLTKESRTEIWVSLTVNYDLEFPDHISDEAKDLISSVLALEPGSRLSLEEIIAHPWIQENSVLHVEED